MVIRVIHCCDDFVNNSTQVKEKGTLLLKYVVVYTCDISTYCYCYVEYV